MAVDQPALVLAGSAPGKSQRPLEGRTALALMRSGAWQLMRVAAWDQREDGVWRCLLLWGVWGTVWEAWYVFDPARLTPLAPAATRSRQCEGTARQGRWLPAMPGEPENS